MPEFDTSNWVNVGILVVTGLVGILSWLGSRTAAGEANAAARRSASAAEEANKIQARLVEIEEQRHRQEALAQGKALLTASIERAARASERPVNHWDLLVRNRGAAEARNVMITVNGQSLSATAVIGSDTEIRCSLPGRPDFETELFWEDDTRLRGHWKSTLR